MPQNSSPIVLITGCTPGGIGHALSLEYASHGCRVIATARRPEVLSYVDSTTLPSLSDFKPGSIIGLELDVTKEETIIALANLIQTTLDGRIDVLFNNAGVGCCFPVLDTPMSRIRNVFETNVFGTIQLTQAIAPMMIKRRSGKIINVSSITTVVTTPWSGIYTATKGAIDQYTHALRMELSPFSIEVTLLKPGSVATNIQKGHFQQGTTLPEVSAYHPYLPSILKRSTHISPKSTRTSEFAREVVNMSLKSSSLPIEFWFGHLTWLFWFLSFFPLWVRHFVMKRQFSLSAKCQN